MLRLVRGGRQVIIKVRLAIIVAELVEIFLPVVHLGLPSMARIHEALVDILCLRLMKWHLYVLIGCIVRKMAPIRVRLSMPSIMLPFLVFLIILILILISTLVSIRPIEISRNFCRELSANISIITLSRQVCLLVCAVPILMMALILHRRIRRIEAPRSVMHLAAVITGVALRALSPSSSFVVVPHLFVFVGLIVFHDILRNNKYKLIFESIRNMVFFYDTETSQGYRRSRFDIRINYAQIVFC